MTLERRIALRIAAIYALVAAVWILFSDQFVALVAPDTRTFAYLETIKGWMFVAITAALLCWLVQRHVRAILRSEEELRERNEELEQVNGELAQVNEELTQTEEELLQQLDELGLNRRELHESNEALRALLEAAPLAIVAIDTDGFVTQWNVAAERMFGWRAEEVIGQEYPLIPPSERHVFHEKLARVNQGECNELQAERRLMKNGRLLDVEVATAPIHGHGGQVSGAIVVLADRSEQAAAEAEILQSNHRFLELVNSIDGIVLEADLRKDRTVFVSERSREILGYAPEEWYASDTFWTDRIHPDDRERVLAENMGARREGKNLRTEYRFLAADGRAVWFKDVISVTMEHGEAVKLRGVMVDITARKAAERALQESEELFRQIFSQNEDAIVLLAPGSFDVLDANPAAEALLGFPREEMVRLGPWSFIAPEEYKSFIQAVPRSGECPFHIDRLGALKMDGARIFVSIWGKVVRLREKEVIYCSIRDITERVKMEEEMRDTQARLIQTNKMTSLGVLVSGIAHEINNPNSYISVNATLLRDVWRDADPVLAEHAAEHGDFPLGGLPFFEMRETAPRLFNGLVEGARRISAIVTNLKDFAREDTGGPLREIDVNRVIADAVTILGHHIHKHTEHFSVEYAGKLPPVRGSHQQIEQVVINLVMNALQALPDKGHGVRVTTAHDADRGQVVITVRDEGQGMSRRVMERSTEPFFSTRLDQGGTGLGLSISASIVKEHRGALEFESVPRRGTTVLVRLPAAQGT